MKFLSGTRNRTVTYVVEPARQITDISSGRSMVTPPLRIVFKEHRFDSDAPGMMEQYAEFARHEKLRRGPNDETPEVDLVQEVKARVEKHLLEHKEFGRGDGRGIFLDNTDTLTQEQMARGAVRRCMFIQTVGDESIQCEQQVVDDSSDFCEAHQRILEGVGVGGSPGPAVPSV